MRTKGWLILLLGSVAVGCCSCASDEVSRQANEEGVYTRYNLHYVAEHGTVKASFANWTDWPGHGFVPYNSRVLAQGWSNRIHFQTDTGLRINFEINPGRMGMSATQYLALITSPTQVTYENLSDVDRQGIEAGKALVGMSKQGVMIALGYPAQHRTPSLDDNRWTYWKGRHDTYVVEFDGSGKVAAITG
ncbi:MAG: outer membrane protein assembly factor BamE [Planctomycetes bacterium]|nr:outer membrane protein assembly factor BamE [Planctomycetota bacterium]